MNSQIDTPAPDLAIAAGKKKKTSGRKPGRPYRRLADDVLGVRRDTLNKKLQVLVARRTLLEDRLTAYEQELAARKDDSKTVD
jgi:hypothetical protein